jgi:hypothetical protein
MAGKESDLRVWRESLGTQNQEENLLPRPFKSCYLAPSKVVTSSLQKLLPRPLKIELLRKANILDGLSVQKINPLWRLYIVKQALA